MRETPYLLDTLADLPPDLQAAASRVLPPEDVPQVIVWIPAHTQTLQKRRRVPPQALLFTTAGVLSVQTGADPIYLRNADVLLVEHHLILLYGCLQFVGWAQGELRRILVEYNTVGEPLLHTALQRVVRQAYGGMDSAPPARDAATLALLEQLGAQSFKFRNGLQIYALLPEERVVDYVWQPRITRRIAGIFRQGVAPAALLALTDRALILIREEKASGAAYGWLIAFCPRQQLVGMSTRPQQIWHHVDIQLTAGLTQSVILEEAQAARWEALWSV